tara:strand:+ start:744 stop:1328 length:585 start_codon:yes stop_codon:yes gene_type:complete
MRFFGKKEKEKKEDLSLPKLPELPELPEMPKMGNREEERIPKLPSYPSNDFGKKFSQNAIKSAVSGGKEDEGDFFRTNEPLEDRGMSRPSKRMTKEMPPFQAKNLQNREKRFPEFPKKQRVMETEPVFVRLDKFEESLEVFEDAKRRMVEIEKILGEIKHLKEQEERELLGWEAEIQELKRKFERIDREIFSKI